MLTKNRLKCEIVKCLNLNYAWAFNIMYVYIYISIINKQSKQKSTLVLVFGNEKMKVLHLKTISKWKIAHDV